MLLAERRPSSCYDNVVVEAFFASLKRERTRRREYRTRGSLVGRRRAMSDPQVAHAKELIAQGKTKREVARLLKVSPATLYRRLGE